MDRATDWVMVNGDLVRASEARLSVRDLGLLRGYGVFDFFRVVSGRALFLNDYLSRFEASAGYLGLALPFSRSDLAEQVERVIQANDLRDAGLHLLLTGGDSPDGFTPDAPNLVIQPRAVTPGSPTAYREGARLISHAYARDLPEAKTTNYTLAIRLLDDQRQAGAVDILFHQDGLASETARSNIFAVKGGVLYTPGTRILRGVTRKQVLTAARSLYPVEETDLALESVLSADEVFISSSLKGVMPIVAIDGRRIGDARPGPVTRALMAAFEARVADYLEQANAS